MASQPNPVAEPEVLEISKMSVNKITAKAARGPVCIILGKATGLKNGEDKATERIWTAIVGTFEGIELATGKRYRSGKLFLPSGFQEKVESAVRQLPETGGVVKFAFEISRVDADNPSGKEYQARNLFPMTAENDELAEIRSLASGKSPVLAPQIEAPKHQAKK